MNEKSYVEIGGSIEKATSGNYNLEVSKLLKEAWNITRSSKLSINLGLWSIFGLGLLVTMIYASFTGGIDSLVEDQQSVLFLNLLLIMLIWPLLAGVEMMGIYHAVGIKTRSTHIFSFLKRGSFVAITATFIWMIVNLGMFLFVIPGVFAAVVTSLAIPLVIEKNLTPFQAIWVCMRAMSFQWYKVFCIYLLMFIMLTVLAIPLAAQQAGSFSGLIVFIAGMCYLAPWFYNVKGLMYREMFGIRVAKGQIDASQFNQIEQDNDSNNGNSGNFSA